MSKISNCLLMLEYLENGRKYNIKKPAEKMNFLLVLSDFLLISIFRTRILMESLHPCSLAAPDSKESQPKRRLQRSSVQIQFVSSAEKSGINLHIV